MNNATSHYLAIDGGGTKTTVWLASGLDQVIGKGQTGPMSLAATSEKKAVENLLKAVEEAIGNQQISSLKKVVIGLAGVDTRSELEHATQLFQQALTEEYQIEEFQLVNDVIIALESGATLPNAIALISGTGSNCMGKNAQGEIVKVSGMDYLLSDQGSGFDIGQQVLRAAVKSYDGRGQKTLIEKLLCEHFQIKSVEELKDKVYHPPLNKTQIGQLSSIAFTALEQNDTKANEIVHGAINELVIMVETVVRRLNLGETEFEVVLVGGIATDPYVKKLLKMKLQVKFPQVKLVVPEEKPVFGALKLAVN